MTGHRIEVTGFAVVPVPDVVLAENPSGGGPWWWLVDHNGEPVTGDWVKESELTRTFNITPGAIPLKRGDRVTDTREDGTVIAVDGGMVWWKGDKYGYQTYGRENLILITGDDA